MHIIHRYGTCCTTRGVNNKKIIITKQIKYNINTRPNHKQQTHSQYNNKDNIKNFNNDNDNNNIINNNIIMLTMLYLNIHITYQAITKKKNYVVLDSILLRNKEFFVQSLNSEIIYFYLFQIN